MWFFRFRDAKLAADGFAFRQQPFIAERAAAVIGF